MRAELGPVYDDLREIRTPSENEIEFVLNRPSRLLLEGLGFAIQTGPQAATGPFRVSEVASKGVILDAFDRYYRGKPVLNEVFIKPYTSIRSAWADMLRGQVDMLYEVGVEALDLLTPSSDIQIFKFDRPYAFMVVLNTRKPLLRQASFRRALNAAVDRDELIKTALMGHGVPADSPVWPHHWASQSAAVSFEYDPEELGGLGSEATFTCLYSDASYERMALVLQRQLHAVGVNVTLEFAPFDQVAPRLESGDFDAFLSDIGQGPTLIRPYLFWHSQAPYNWGGFRSKKVDLALDRIRHAANDQDYEAGVADFRRAMVDDPPAIFLAWSQRARAVSTRFEVPVEEGRDILSTLRLWRPVGPPQRAQRN